MNLKNNSVLFFGSFILSGFSSFIGTSLYSHLLSVNDFGEYSVGLAAFSIINALFFQWNKLSLLRFLDGENNLSVLTNTAFLYSVISIIVFVVYVIIYVAGFDTGFFFFVVIYTICFSFFDLINSYSRANQDSVNFFLANLIKSTLSIVLAGFFLWWYKANASTLFFTLSVAFVLPVFLYTEKIMVLLSSKGINLFQVIDANIVSDLMKFGLPLGLSLFCSSSIFSISRIVSAHLCSLTDLAVFSAYYMVIQQSVMTLSMACNSFGYTNLVRAYKDGNLRQIKKTLDFNLILLMNFILPLILLVCFCGQGIFRIYFPVSYHNYSNLDIQLTLLTILLFVLKSYYLEQPYHLAHKTKFLFKASLIASLTNIVTIYPLVGFYGTRGAIISMFISYLVNVAVLILYDKPEISIIPNIKVIKLIVCFCLFVCFMVVLVFKFALTDIFIILYTSFFCLVLHLYGWYLYFQKDD